MPIKGAIATSTYRYKRPPRKWKAAALETRNMTTLIRFNRDDAIAIFAPCLMDDGQYEKASKASDSGDWVNPRLRQSTNAPSKGVQRPTCHGRRG